MRPKILFPPGFGDNYWNLAKMESFCEVHNYERPMVWTWEGGTGAYVNNKPRTVGYLDRFKCIEYMGGWQGAPHGVPEWAHFWHESTEPQFRGIKRNPGQLTWIQHNLFGFDHCIVTNGIMEYGYTLEAPEVGLDKYKTNWYVPVWPEVLEREAEYTAEYKKNYGRYIMAYFSGTSHYGEKYYRKVGFDKLAALLLDLAKVTKAEHVLLVGVHWDTTSCNAISSYDKTGTLVNLVNQTNPQQLIALIKGAIGCIGTHCGAIMLPVWEKKPTIMLFPKDTTYWTPGLIKNHVPPESLGHWYFPFYIENFHPQRDLMIKTAERIFERE